MLDQLSRGELLRVMDLATECLTASTFEQLDSVISGLSDLVSFQKAALCAVRPAQDDLTLEHYMNHSYGADWAALYIRRRMHRVDPVLAHALTANGAFRWHDALANNFHQASKTFIEAAKDFGLVDGVSYSGASHPASPLRTVLSLTGVDAGDPDRALQVISALGPHVHESYKRLLQLGPEARASRPLLSPREKEILSWTQQGKTYWEIGCILGISQRTVKYHFASIKAKLDVVSAAHAIAKGMRIGLIS